MTDDCLKLSIYFSEDDRHDHTFVSDSLLELFASRRVEVSVLLAGAEGFGVEHDFHTDRFVESARDLPLKVTAVGARATIERLLPQATALITSGTVTLTSARLLGAELEPLAGTEHCQDATRLTVFVARDETVDGIRAYRVAVARLHACGVAGATVLGGLDGTLQGQRERAGLFTRHPHTPLTIVSVGPTRQIVEALPAIREILPDPIMTLEPVRICKKDGMLLDEPETAPQQHDQDGCEALQKFVIYSGLHSKHRRHTVHRELVEALRRSPAWGVTVFRGRWGYAHDDTPHGDGAWSFQRRVPTVTVVIEQAARGAETFAVIDRVTESAGLVTSEVVRGFHVSSPSPREGSVRHRLHPRSSSNG